LAALAFEAVEHDDDGRIDLANSIVAIFEFTGMEIKLSALRHFFFHLLLRNLYEDPVFLGKTGS
jgi:hypothetical protein